MIIQEAVYTSASDLLEDTTGHLGIVAKSRGIPQEVEVELRAHRAYSLLPDISVDAVNAHPPRFIFSTYGNGSAFFGVTRIVFAGADHTGRTTPLAHHLLVSREELNGARPADFISATKESYLGRWNGQARWIDPARVVSAVPQDEISPVCLEELIGSGATLLATLSCIAEALVRYPISQRPVVVCVPRTASTQVLELMALILDMLPSTIQLETHGVSHVITPADQPRGFALALTYADTPFMRHCSERQDERRPVVVDLTRVSTLPKAVEGTYGTLVANALESGGMRAVQDLASAWDEMALDANLIELFPAVVKLREGLVGNILYTPGSTNRLAPLLGKLSVGAKIQRPVADHCLAAVQRLGNSSVVSRWETLAIIGGDGRWPKVAQDCSLDLICGNYRDALTHIATTRTLEGDKSSALNDSHLAQIIAARPQLLEMALENASKASSAAELELAAQFLERAGLRFDAACKLLPRIASLNIASQNSLETSCAKMLRRSIKSSDHITRLCSLAEELPQAPLLRRMSLSLLDESLPQVSDQAKWQQLSLWHIRFSLQEGRVHESIESIVTKCRGRISDVVVSKWLAHFATTPNIAELESVLGQFQLMPAPPVVSALRPQRPMQPAAHTVSASVKNRISEESAKQHAYLKWSLRTRKKAINLGVVTLILGIGIAALFNWRFQERWISPFSLLTTLWSSTPLVFLCLTEILLRRMIREREQFQLAWQIRRMVHTASILTLLSLLSAASLIVILVCLNSFPPRLQSWFPFLH